MTRLNFFMLMALVCSAVYLVHVSYESRRLFAALDRAHTESRTLDIEHERLKAEKQAQATSLRVERVARDKLAMRNASPAVTQYVAYVAPSALPSAPISAPTSAPTSAATSASAPAVGGAK